VLVVTGCGSSKKSSSAAGAANTQAAATAATTATTAASSTSAAPGSAAAASSGVTGTPCAVSSTAATSVNVTETEWSITPSAATAKAGEVGFVATNTGKASHELVVIKADSFDALPKDANGGVDESKLPTGALIGRSAHFKAGDAPCAETFNLPAGNYVLICNIEFNQGGTVTAHAQKGMHTAFQVSA